MGLLNLLPVAAHAQPARSVDQLVYVALAQPCRLLDTRAGSGTGTPLTAAHGAYLFGTDNASIKSTAQHGSSTGCGVPVGVEAVNVNMDMLDASGTGNIATWNPDSGASAPNIGTGVYNASVQFNTGYSTVPVGAPYQFLDFSDPNPNAGKFYLQVANGQIDMTINLVGYWLPMSWNATRSGPYSVALGLNAAAQGIYSTAMGYQTGAIGNASTAIGEYAAANGEGAIAIGSITAANGDYSTAMGNNATVIASAYGSFVYGDGSAPVANGYHGQFMVLADSATVFYSGHTSNTNQSDWPGVGLSHGAGSWSTLSDRAAKDTFVPVDARAILNRLVTLPMTTWHYKLQDPSIRHIGAIAQDFRAAFDVGEDERHISTVDADGVALAAIQGLNAKLEESNAELKTQLTAVQSEKDHQISVLTATVAAQGEQLAAQAGMLAALNREFTETRTQLQALLQSSAQARAPLAAYPRRRHGDAFVAVVQP